MPTSSLSAGRWRDASALLPIEAGNPLKQDTASASRAGGNGTDTLEAVLVCFIYITKMTI